MNENVREVLLRHFPTMTDEQLTEMMTDVTGCYHDAFGEDRVWLSPQLVFLLLSDLAENME